MRAASNLASTVTHASATASSQSHPLVYPVRLAPSRSTWFTSEARKRLEGESSRGRSSSTESLLCKSQRRSALGTVHTDTGHTGLTASGCGRLVLSFHWSILQSDSVSPARVLARAPRIDRWAPVFFNAPAPHEGQRRPLTPLDRDCKDAWPPCMMLLLGAMHDLLHALDWAI